MLSPNMTITTEQGNSITILEQIGSGGCADVYAISVSGSDKPKALKWFRNPEDQWNISVFENARKLSKIESPDSRMLWIEDTVSYKNEFGYISPLLPQGYVSLSNYLRKPTHYSHRIASICALDYIRAMYNTHNRGLLFFTVDGEADCYIHPPTGHLLVNNCERIAYVGDPFSISYPLARFAAPELVTGETTQNIETNRFSLALILFLILFRGHPLEGKSAMQVCMTPSISRHVYGEHPVFIFDPDDDSNSPVRGVHVTVERLWTEAPGYLKAIFEKAFSQEALHNPNLRPKERDYAEVLLRYLNDLNHNNQ